MPTPPPPTKRVPLGKPLKHTEKELDELAAVTPADIEAAKVFWRKHAPKKQKALLDAEPTDDAATTPNA